MSAFVPTNLLIVGGMLMPNPSLKGVIFWQWANQSLNGTFLSFVCSPGRDPDLRTCPRSVRQLLEREQKHSHEQLGDCQ